MARPAEETPEWHRMPEKALLHAAKQGSHAAFGELVRRYQDAVYNLCYRLLGDPLEAEDAAQEVFLRVYRNLSRYDLERRFSTWVLAITTNHCIDRLRRRRVQWVPLDDARASRRPASTVEEHVLRQEVCDAVQAMLDRLNVDDRLVLVLHYWYDMNYRDIARILGTSEAAVKTRAHRARQRLGTLLKEEGWEP